MLMICSSRARNRSPDPVVSCFFGRIAPSNAATESRLPIRGNLQNEIASFGRSDPESLRSQKHQRFKIRLLVKGLQVVHGQPVIWPVNTADDHRTTIAHFSSV